LLSWVELDSDAIRWNLEQFRSRLDDGASLAPVVKSNAYGHGILQVAEILRDAAVEWMCVNRVEEAVELREAGHRCAILVLGYIPLEALDLVVRHELRPVVYNPQTVQRLAELTVGAATPLPVHVKLETGTYRQGVGEADLGEFVQAIVQAPGLLLEGASTHFANIEDTTDHGFAERQIETFHRMARSVEETVGRPLIRHAACSAAALLFSRTHLNLVRLGISLYGIWPSRETFVSCKDRGKPTLDLRPALTWKTRIAQIKQVDEGCFVGYGCTHRTTRDSSVAVLPLGYHEGYDRGLSGVAHVLIRGRRAPMLGRICMNMCMVDVTDIDGALLEDEVVLLGSQGEERISAEQLAAWCSTIPYEILARIHPALPRINSAR